MRTALAALALPLLSPAAVLALHLATEHAPAYHAELVRLGLGLGGLGLGLGLGFS